jgi:hypothetical protein
MQFPTRFSDFPFKIWCLLLFAEGELPYIRRKGTSYIVTIRPLRHRFHKTSKEMTSAFHSMVKMGYIYNFSVQASEYYFKIHLPKWLSLTTEVNSVSQDN